MREYRCCRIGLADAGPVKFDVGMLQDTLMVAVGLAVAYEDKPLRNQMWRSRCGLFLQTMQSVPNNPLSPKVLGFVGGADAGKYIA